MQFTKASNDELFIMIVGLRAVAVPDKESVHRNLLAKAKSALSARGLRVPETA